MSNKRTDTVINVFYDRNVIYVNADSVVNTVHIICRRERKRKKDRRTKKALTNGLV